MYKIYALDIKKRYKKTMELMGKNLEKGGQKKVAGKNLDKN